MHKLNDESIGIKDQNYTKKFIDFFDKLRAILIKFSDFKKLDFQPWSHDLFFKLVAKEIIFIIRVPSQSYLEKLLLKQVLTTIRFEYFIIKKKQMKLTGRLKQNTVFKNFLDTNTQKMMPGIG